MRRSSFARTGVSTLPAEETPDDGIPGSVQVLATPARLDSHEAEQDASFKAELEISFNIKLLQEAMEAILIPDVALETSVASSPSLIRPVVVGKII